MKNIDSIIEAFFGTNYPDFQKLQEIPEWLIGKRWRPNYFFKSKENIIAVDILRSGIIPRFQYTNIVGGLQKERKEFRVIIIVLDANLQNDPEIKPFCKENKIGLLSLIPGIGLEPILSLDINAPVTKKLIQEKGWFPKAILENAKNLKNLCFYKQINEFVGKIGEYDNDSLKAKELVKSTIDGLISYHPSFKSKIEHFMKLDHFESLLKLSIPESSDHVFHSFRVFLAGCPVIDKFYKEFKNAHRNISIMIQETQLRVEYIWLLTSIFHDIGRPKESAKILILNELGDEDTDVQVSGKKSRWTKDNYISARRILGSLASFVVDTDGSSQWDGGTIEDENAERFTAVWLSCYDKYESHAVISAFDFLADILLKAKSTSEKGNRAFVVSHAVPAALSILLHDWKTWKTARKLNLIPVNFKILPIAALLIYIDTWDNYRRKGSDSLINIKDYTINQDGVEVKIEWGDSDKLKGDEIGYSEFEKAVDNLSFDMGIEYGLVGEI